MTPEDTATNETTRTQTSALCVYIFGVSSSPPHDGSIRASVLCSRAAQAGRTVAYFGASSAARATKQAGNNFDKSCRQRAMLAPMFFNSRLNFTWMPPAHFGRTKA